MVLQFFISYAKPPDKGSQALSPDFEAFARSPGLWQVEPFEPWLHIYTIIVAFQEIMKRYTGLDGSFGWRLVQVVAPKLPFPSFFFEVLA